MVASYIIVRCAPLYGADEAVFTGQMKLVEGPTAMATNIPWIMCDGETSPHIEHAVAFQDLFQATVWSDRLMRHYREDQRQYDTQTWFVRNDGDFAVGENLHHKDVRYTTLDAKGIIWADPKREKGAGMTTARPVGADAR